MPPLTFSMSRSLWVAFCLLPTGKKWIWEKTVDFQTKSRKKCCESCSQWSAHCKTWNKNHLRRQKREWLVLMAADVWVYNSTVYNTNGTTWSGSPLWKQAQQEVRQHWFIDSYIAASIQVQYRVTGVHPTGLTVARGVGRCPQYSTLDIKKHSNFLKKLFMKIVPSSFNGTCTVNVNLI